MVNFQRTEEEKNKTDSTRAELGLNTNLLGHTPFPSDCQWQRQGQL